MYKSLLFLYLICFGCYVLFTRQPDYFDGEKVPALIRSVRDSVSGQSVHFAVYSDGYHRFQVPANYLFRRWKNGEKATVIYETEHPERGAVYAFWGYWMGLGELIGSILFLVISYQIAVSITRNPTAEALIEQLEYKEPDKPRYD